MQYDKLSTRVKAQGISAHEAEGSTHYLVIQNTKIRNDDWGGVGQQYRRMGDQNRRQRRKRHST